MEIALSVLCVVLAGLVVYIIQDAKTTMQSFRAEILKELHEVKRGIQACTTQIAVLEDREERREHNG